MLYWKPKPEIPTDPWYQCQPVGKHKLNGMVARMCEEAGLSKRKTNHSLCVTGATSLYSGGVPERERTGHRSLEALRKYERTAEEQHPTNCPTHHIWSLLVTHSHPVVFQYHKCSLLFCILVPVFHPGL